MGIKDRLRKLEGDDHPDPPACEACGDSYALMRIIDTGPIGPRPVGQLPNEVCKVCEGPRREWAEKSGQINQLRIVLAPEREELLRGNQRREDGR